MEAGSHPDTSEILNGEIIPPAPQPSQAEVVALNTLLKSEWFGNECESANYHSLHDFLAELQDTAASFVASREKPA